MREMSTSSSPASATNETVPSSEKMVLVVEDDLSYGSVIVQAIKSETPYNAVLASSGIEALNIISHIKCDLFLLDYHLPHMDGFELYDRLHATKGYEKTPALFLSASNRLSQEALAQRNLKGFTKLIELDELLREIRSMLEKKDEDA